MYWPIPASEAVFAPVGASAFAGFRSARVIGRGTSSANAGSASANAAMTMSERTNQRTRIQGLLSTGVGVRSTPAVPTVLRTTHPCRADQADAVFVELIPLVAAQTIAIATVRPTAEPTNSCD